MNYAIIENGIVTNIIVGPLPNGMYGVCTDELDVAIGDRYEDGAFIKQNPPSLDDQIAALKAKLLALEMQKEVEV